MQLGKFFNRNWVVLSIVMIVVGAGISSWAAVYNPQVGHNPLTNINYADNGQGFISTSRDSRLFNATSSDLQQAIWHLNGTDGTITIPNGTITVTDTLTMDDGVTIQGMSGFDTRIIHSVADGPLFDITDDTYSQTMGGLKKFSIYSSDTQQNVINVTSGDYFTIENIFFRNNNNTCIYLDGTQGVTIRDCFFYRNTLAGNDADMIQLDSELVFCTGTVIDHCQFGRNSARHAVNVTDASGTIIQNNWFEGGAYGNFNVTRLCGGRNTQILNNRVAGTGTNRHVWILDRSGAWGDDKITQYVNIMGNTVSGVTGTGELLTHTDEEDVQQLVFTNNIVDGNITFTGGSCVLQDSVICDNVFLYGHIDIRGTFRVVIEGNRITPNSYYGINIAAPSATTITGNSIHNGVVGVRLVTGSTLGNNVVGNFMYDCSSYGVFYDGDSDEKIIISDNIIDGDDTGSSEGVFLSTDAWNAVVTGNVITDFTKGVFLHSSTENCTVSDNNVIDCTTGVDNDGSNNLVVLNTGFLNVIPTENITQDVQPGFAWYDTTNHKLMVYEGSGVWKSSTFA